MESYDVALGKSKAETKWIQNYYTWEEFVGRLRKVRRTPETVKEYRTKGSNARSAIKDGPCFVAGLVAGGRRKRENIQSRSMITLDADHGDEEFIGLAEHVLRHYNWCYYSTHSHTPKQPKYRIVVPVDRNLSPDEYSAVSRMLAAEIDMSAFDKTTFNVDRLMFLPSCSIDAEPVFEAYTDQKPLSVDEWLAKYDNWQDPSSWPRHEDEKESLRVSSGKHLSNPRSKEGIVGLFCNQFTISQAIDKFLSDTYISVPHTSDRYTYIGATAIGGLVVYDDLFAYSHHESDPIRGQEVNAFDLVRIHKFGHLDYRTSPTTRIDRLPSQLAMREFTMGIPEIKKTRFAELSEGLDVGNSDDDDSWQEQLEYMPKTQELISNGRNVELILSNGPFKNALGFDEFAKKIMILKPNPISKKTGEWKSVYDKLLYHFFNTTYQIKGENIVHNAFIYVTQKNKFHPVKDYLESAVWDGDPRAETLFIDYLGTEDNEYTRAVNRKMLLAAIKRIYEPGCKFDYMCVLIGKQGEGKSAFIKKLAVDWFNESLSFTDDKHTLEQLQDGWIFEIPEMDKMNKAEIGYIKRFLSTTNDKFRPSYGQVVETYPRHCIIFGTHNDRNFLTDQTGNRRFWTIDTDVKTAPKSIWHDLTADEVCQIWAEVMEWYKNGEIYLELPKEVLPIAEASQKEHEKELSWEGTIIGWLDGVGRSAMYDETCPIQIWVECLNGKQIDFKPNHGRDIAHVLRRNNWVQNGQKTFRDYGKQRLWERSKNVNSLKLVKPKIMEDKDI